MNILKSASLALAISLAATCVGVMGSANAQETMMSGDVSVGTQTTAQVESIDGDIVTVRTNDGVVRTYEFSPGLVSQLRLTTGSTVIVDTMGVQVGTIRRLTPYLAAIDLANGDTETFYLPEESRRTLMPGDMVAIRPSGVLTRITDNPVLSAQNVRVYQPVVSSTSTQDTFQQQTQVEIQRDISTQTEATIQTDTQVTSTPAQEVQPVPGLW